VAFGLRSAFLDAGGGVEQGSERLGCGKALEKRIREVDRGRVEIEVAGV
jgi:hypothetical protein